MNILSISQLQTQNSQIDLQQNAGRTEAEKSSFADFLRDARKSTETENPVKRDENPAAESEKIAKSDEAGSNKIEEKKADLEKDFGEKSGIENLNQISQEIQNLTEQKNLLEKEKND